MLLISHLQDQKNPYSLVILPVLNLLYRFVTWSPGRNLNKNLGRRNLHSPQRQLCDAGIFHRLYPRLQHERSWKVAVKVRQISALKVLKRGLWSFYDVHPRYVLGNRGLCSSFLGNTTVVSKKGVDRYRYFLVFMKWRRPGRGVEITVMWLFRLWISVRFFHKSSTNW